MYDEQNNDKNMLILTSSKEKADGSKTEQLILEAWQKVDSREQDVYSKSALTISAIIILHFKFMFYKHCYI